MIGPNGAGKTTLFNMIAGVFAPDGGTITFRGERIDGLRADASAARGIGAHLPARAAIPGLTVEDNVDRRRAVAASTSRDARAPARTTFCAASTCSTSAR